jgi:ADP-ribose pyrophosphatase YjhB (NUDIX family)
MARPPADTIRPLALALIRRGSEFLVFQAEDPATGREFYRPLGGGIEFGERSEDALSREFKEEIGAELTGLMLLDVLENVFEYEGEARHELVFLYEAKFADAAFYKKDGLPILDSKKGRTAEWVDRDTLLGANFYPEGIERYV